MKVNILASGSSGNCISIQSGETTILIDAGIPKTKIEQRLLDVGIRADEVNAIFVSHAHGDHIKGLPIANKYRIPVYASEGEWKSIEGVDEELQRPLLPNNCVINPVWDFDVHYFDVHHDAYEPLGYVIDGNQKVSICLDTGHVDDEMLEAMRDSDIYVIESNHIVSLVEQCNRPTSIITRILSDIGHLSNDQTADALSKLIQGKGEQIYLTHLSKGNNDPIKAANTVKLKLFEKGFIAGKHYQLEVMG